MVPLDKVRHASEHGHESTSLLLLELLLGYFLLQSLLEALCSGLLILHLHLLDHLGAHVVLYHVDQAMGAQATNLLPMHWANTRNQVPIFPDHGALASIVLVVSVLVELFLHQFQAFDIAQVLRGPLILFVLLGCFHLIVDHIKRAH